MIQRVLAALPLLVLIPFAARAQSASPVPAASAAAAPIKITSCDLNTQHGQLGFGSLYFNGKAYNFFKVGFENDAKVTADRVVFQVDFKDSRYVVGDSGSYAPGVSISHVYRDHGRDVTASARPAGSDGSTQCAVLSVHFTDGTSWTAPGSAPATK